MGFFDFLGYGGGDPSGHDRRSLQGLGDQEQTMGQHGQEAFEGQDRDQLNQSYGGLNQTNANMGQTQDYLRGQMQGQNSVSAEQLRQGLQQQQAAQMSMAASNPGNPMAARTAAMQMARSGYGMAGQQALAGLQERNNAATQLGQSYGQQGQLQLGQGQLALGRSSQDLQAGLGGYNAANNAYGQSLAHPQKTWGDLIKSGAGGAAGIAGPLLAGGAAAAGGGGGSTTVDGGADGAGNEGTGLGGGDPSGYDDGTGAGPGTEPGQIDPNPGGGSFPGDGYY